MSKEYWYQFECTNCHKKFKVLQQDADDVIECPFCKIRPWGFNVSGTKKKGLTVDEFIDQAEKFLEEDVTRDMKTLGFDYEYINIFNDSVEAAADGTIKGKFEAFNPNNEPISDYIVSYNIVDGSWNIHTMQPYDYD